MLVIALESVRWIQSEGNYLRLHTADGEYVTRMKISDIEGQLDPRDFARVHRSAIANLRHVVAFRSFKRAHVITFDDGSEIPMSSRYSGRVLSMFL
jgi:two-component system, LytTR family, response regulator